MLRILALLILWLLGTDAVLAQGTNLGIPPVRNFSRKIYRAGTQNWDAAQDRRGVLYWANNEGLLEFDGTTWRCYPVRNGTIVRSVWIDPSGRIYVGAQSEIGYFYPDDAGRLTYHSLTALLSPDNRNFEDVWDIVPHASGVFFRTNHSVFRYRDGVMDAYEPGGTLQFMGRAGEALIIQQGDRALLRFTGTGFEPWLEGPEFSGPVTSLLPFGGDTVLITTLKNGLFFHTADRLTPWTTAHDDFLRERRVYCATWLPDGNLALGTSSGGLVLLDRAGRLVRRLDKKSGLQNSNILCVYADHDANLWLGLDTGIDYVAVGSPFTTIFPDGALESTGYTAAVHGGRIYFGTATGLYTAPWSVYFDPLRPDVFTPVRGSEGQTWSLNTANGRQLLLGHHEGAFAVDGAEARRLSPRVGAWTFVPLSDQWLLGGTYEGLSLYRDVAGQWRFERALAGLDESARIMVGGPDGVVWISHPYRGVYRVTPGRDQTAVDVVFYDSRAGLPSDLNNYVFNIRGRMVVGTERGVYRFDDAAGQFRPDTSFHRALGSDRRVKYLREDPDGNIWYVAGDEVGLLVVDDLGLTKNWQKRVFPELSGRLVGGFEFIYPFDRSNVFFGAEKGFIHFNPQQYRGPQRAPRVLLTRVSLLAGRDSLLFGGWYAGPDSISATQPDDCRPVLASGLNALRFAFSAGAGADPTTTEYRCFLEGLDPDWSGWSLESERDYTNLGPGQYVFHVQARGANGAESATVRYAFRILPPWYAGTLAKAVYLLACFAALGLVIRRQKLHYEREKARLHSAHREKEAEHLHTVARTEAELASVRHEKLEAEIAFKNQELATATMHLVQKGEILQKMQEALLQLKEKSTHAELRKDLGQLLHLIEADTRLDQDWEQFAYHFDQVHVDFLKRLRERFPQLSPNDHRLCAYLRMNLSTKEIAPLMNISVRGVEASRYRLRKKMGLPNDANLTEVMMEV